MSNVFPSTHYFSSSSKPLVELGQAVIEVRHHAAWYFVNQ